MQSPPRGELTQEADPIKIMDIFNSLPDVH